MAWKARKNGKFSMKAFYSPLELEGYSVFPHKDSVRFLGSYRSGLFCMGKSLREVF